MTNCYIRTLFCCVCTVQCLSAGSKSTLKAFIIKQMNPRLGLQLPRSFQTAGRVLACPSCSLLSPHLMVEPQHSSELQMEYEVWASVHNTIAMCLAPEISGNAFEVNMDPFLPSLYFVQLIHRFERFIFCPSNAFMFLKAAYNN